MRGQKQKEEADVNFDDFMEQAFMKVKTNCMNCGKEMVYEPSLNLAKSKGVTENALMCSHCHRVYLYYNRPGELRLTEDITANYPEILAKAEPGEAKEKAKAKAETAEKAPEPKPQSKPEPEAVPAKKKGFFAKLFG